MFLQVADFALTSRRQEINYNT